MKLSIKYVARHFVLVVLSFFLSLPFANADDMADRNKRETLELTAAALVGYSRDFYHKTGPFDDKLHEFRITVQAIGNKSYDLYIALKEGDSGTNIEAIFVEILTLQNTFSHQLHDQLASSSSSLDEITYIQYMHEAISHKLHRFARNSVSGSETNKL